MKNKDIIVELLILILVKLEEILRNIKKRSAQLSHNECESFFH